MNGAKGSPHTVIMSTLPFTFLLLHVSHGQDAVVKLDNYLQGLKLLGKLKRILTCIAVLINLFNNPHILYIINKKRDIRGENKRKKNPSLFPPHDSHQ